MSDRFRFRQEVKPSHQKSFDSVWHYWGYVEDGFVAPVGANVGGKG